MESARLWSLWKNGKKGIKDEIGKEPSPMPANKSSIELGTENPDTPGRKACHRRNLYFVSRHRSIFERTPVRRHLRARQPGFPEQEIATISALANMRESQSPTAGLISTLGLNVGLTEAQMRSLISVLEAKVGKKEADNANEILSKVLGSRAK